jgi:hypothetical protein
VRYLAHEAFRSARCCSALTSSTPFCPHCKMFLSVGFCKLRRPVTEMCVPNSFSQMLDGCRHFWCLCRDFDQHYAAFIAHQNCSHGNTPIPNGLAGLIAVSALALRLLSIL